MTFNVFVMRTNYFKPLFVTIAIALLTSLSIPVLADDPPKDQPERKSVIEIIAARVKHETDRSLPLFVEAFHDSHNMVVELTCHGLGSTEVYIVDSFGNVVNTRTFNSDYEPFILLDAPTIPGTYYLVIIADGYYGEGMFTVE